MRSGRVSIFNGNQPTANVITRNLRVDRRRVFKLGGKVGHVTRHAELLFKVKRSKVKVTRSRAVSACAETHMSFFNTGLCIIFADDFNYFHRRATEVA